MQQVMILRIELCIYYIFCKYHISAKGQNLRSFPITMIKYYSDLVMNEKTIFGKISNLKIDLISQTYIPHSEVANYAF